MLLKGIVKEIDARDPARPAMLEAIEVASSIAALDENEHTRRAAALYGLGRAIEGFPVRRERSLPGRERILIFVNGYLHRPV